MTRRRAFTLLEVLTAVAIIAILITMLALGMRHMGKSGRQRATATMLGNLKNLTTEREVSGGLSAVNAIYAGLPNQQEVAPANMAEGQETANGRVPVWTPPPTEPGNAVARTQAVLNRLKSIPNVARMIAALPADQLWMPDPPPANMPVGSSPLVLDAWRNPILYVPADGLAGVRVTGSSATGTTVTVITAPGNRPFWASAGDDGYFSAMPGPDGTLGTADDLPAGDDNVYSFEN